MEFLHLVWSELQHFDDYITPTAYCRYYEKQHQSQVIVPTGGGKTMCMIHDLKRRLQTTEGGTLSWYPKTYVVVAPRILLANQLCSEFLEQNLDGNL